MKFRNLLVKLNDDDTIESISVKTPVDSITFTTDRCTVEEMWQDIATTAKILLKQDNYIKIREDENNIIVIEFSHDNSLSDYGGNYLLWATEDEVDYVDIIRSELEDVLDGQIAMDFMNSEE